MAEIIKNQAAAPENCGENDGIMYGYAGKILRIDLTHSTTEEIPSSKYLPEFVGGKMLCSAIFWDEVPAGTGAFDPGNKLILAAGPTTGTGIPTGGRTTMAGIGPNSLPEQYSTGSIGGRMGTVMKYAGYDAIIIEGCAPEHTYVYIEDDKIEFRNADLIWGMRVHDCQRALQLAHGLDACNMVIGPAGENLVRIATITTSLDHAFSKSGFGAVFGSKKLKALVIKGSGSITPGNIPKIFELRQKVGEAKQIVNLPEKQGGFGAGKNHIDHEWEMCRFACSPGCTCRCQKAMLDVDSVLGGEKIDQLEKCVSLRSYGTNYDGTFPTQLFITSEKNNRSQGMIRSWNKQPDPTDPYWDIIQKEAIPGDEINFYGNSFERGQMMNQLTNEYGLDKWDITIWYFGWIGMAGKEGLLDDLDFGMKPDPDDPQFVRKFITDITYRRGIGDLFAEGMARAIRTLGKEKYGDTIFTHRTSATGEKRDLAVSMEVGWGQATHWTGRGTQGTPKWTWLINSLMFMVNTRDAIASGHVHVLPEDLEIFYKDGPSTSQHLIDIAINNEWESMIKDPITACEWQSPNRFYPEQEADMLSAATGKDYTREDLYKLAEKGRLLFRAILIRNFGRDRDLEVPQPYPNMTYPDPRGETCTWEEWNGVVDRYYRTSGWDLETGWPTRSTWEKNGLRFIADELEQLGKLPPEGRTEYTPRPNPIGR